MFLMRNKKEVPENHSDMKLCDKNMYLLLFDCSCICITCK